MKITEALYIIGESKKPKGYRVHFEVRSGGVLTSDYFPNEDEPLIDTEEKAWQLAMEFATATDPYKYVNIYVTTHDHRPVAGYEKREIRRYPPSML